MRKDIKAINEAYSKATSLINEQAQARTPSLDRIYKGYPHDRLIEIYHPSYLDVEDENAEPVDVLYVFLHKPASPGDYDTPPDSESLTLLGSFYNDEYVDINEDDVYEATAKAQQEIATGEDEEGSYEDEEQNDNNGMSDSPEDALYDSLATDGFISLEAFNDLASEVLKKDGYTQDDLENMSIDDAVGEIGDIFGMQLSIEDDRVVLDQYIYPGLERTGTSHRGEEYGDEHNYV